MACVVLHNLCISRNVGIPDDEVVEADTSADDPRDLQEGNEEANSEHYRRVNHELAAGRRHRRQIINSL